MCIFKEMSMLFLLSDKKKRPAAPAKKERNDKARELFLSGRFPVTTTPALDDHRKTGRVLGLVVCRGYDSEETFFGMASRAINKGAEAIVGYQESVAFHPDGSKYFTCYGTAIMFDEN